MEREIAGRVIAIVAEVKKISADSVRAEASFEELGIDSLDRINILFELENAFDIDIPDDEARAITTVQGIIDRLGAYLERRERKGA